MESSLSQNTTLIQQLSSIVGAIPYGIVAVSDSGQVEIVNSLAVSLLGNVDREPRDFIDGPVGLLISELPDMENKYEKLIVSMKRESFTEPYKLFNGDSDILVTCKKMLSGSLFVIEDRTERKALIHDLSHDFLTQLLNRQYFENKLRLVLERSRNTTPDAVFMFIDLDRFKMVNDIAGHSAGDDMLRRVSTTLVSCVKNGDSVARVGGDEFAVIMYGVTVNEARDIALTMLRKVESLKIHSSGKVVDISLSAGVASIDVRQFEDISFLINAADAACRMAKSDNENRVHIIESDNGEYQKYLEETNLNSIVNDAISNSNFYLVVQEIRPHCRDSVSHYEVLIRLNAEDGSNIPPNVFIPVAERSRLMTKIDRWVIQEAFSLVKSGMKLSINLSGQSVSDLTLIDYIVGISERYQVKPEHITFEITETAAIENIEKTKEFVVSLKKYGYQFSLDDFGTGLSSYQYLKDLPVDFIKIDGYFVKDVGDDDFSFAMVESINDFAHKIGLKTIAEFVSSDSIASKIEDMGVDYAQGFHIAKPVPLVDVVRSMEEQVSLKIVH